MNDYNFGFQDNAKSSGISFVKTSATYTPTYADKARSGLGVTLTEVKRPKVNCDAYGRKLNKPTPFVKNGDNRVTLDWWKCYLDSCASYHTFFIKQFLTNITQGGATMTGNCNAGTTTANKQGSYGDFRV